MARYSFSRAAVCLIGVSYFAIGGPTLADDRVLIMTISDYAVQPLEGVKHDAENGLMLARKLDYNTSSATRLRDRDLTLSGMKKALQDLVAQTRSNDRVFIYYSGHGGSSRKNNICEQSLVSQDGQHLFSTEFASYLDQIKHNASKVAVFIDSCHSGGMLSEVNQVRNAKGGALSRVTAKAWAAKDGENCSNGANYVTRSINEVRSAKGITNLANNYVYVTAALDNEYALDDPDSGGLASTSVLKCLDRGVPNLSNSGVVSTNDLVQCAQGQIDKSVEAINAKAGSDSRSRWLSPHIKVSGNADTPILAAQAIAVGGSSPAQGSAAPVKPVNTLKSLLNSQDARWGFNAQPTRSQVAIGEKFQIRYSSNQSGYVYVLYAGSDGKEFKLLYPIVLGDQRKLARKEGNVGKDGGTAEFTITPPAGDNHFLVLLSEQPMEFGDVFRVSDGDASFALATASNASQLGCAAAGGKRNAMASEGAPPCVVSRERNAVASEGSAGDSRITGYGASMFVVNGK